ncbi:hypothetical protein QN277_009825 [Acacia crassicarpa]|uniref:Agglutinin domain-containing protein n=1 Tax=Acacia crassicarpa TaxID=499986 RepID=A0AAE1MC86_9FABA|nr:hypothetical protein QN277_009825 [Acacia crassicarpa]
MSLPKFMVLKSNHNKRYLRYIRQGGETNGYLQFSGEEIVSPYVKFEVKMAKSGNKLVHIRCCYNNKYWRIESTPKHSWIVARADEPEEDQSKSSCTLFKPTYVDNTAKRVKFLHVHHGGYAKVRIAAAPHDSYLFAVSKNHGGVPTLGDVYEIIDWESLLIMPKHVAFKGNNGKYLSVRCIEKHQYLQFTSNDVGDPTVGNEIFTTRDGRIRVKSNHNGKFWRRSNSTNYIWADSSDATNNDSDTLFWPIKHDKSVVALRNLGNKNYCKGLTTMDKRSFLSVGVFTTSKEARIKVEELVTSRHIDNVNFHRLDARIYSKRVLTMDTKVAINKTKKPNNAKLKLSYKKTESSSWNASVSSKLDVNTNFKARVPFIERGKIEILAESKAYQWGTTKTSSTEVKEEYEVIVPPMTTMTVRLLATKGKCDVPFSYTQHDTLTNGKTHTYNMVDGIYSGINFFDFKYEIQKKKNYDVIKMAQMFVGTTFRNPHKTPLVH